MKNSLTDADSLLAIDVGEITTRAMLFDVVDGRYRFLAIGSASTTLGPSDLDIGVGIHHALNRLQEVTGRRLIDTQENLIMPSQADGSGVDTFSATLSLGEPLTVVAVGLLDDISLHSAYRLAETTYTKVAEALSLNDKRKPEERIDAILRVRPDVIIVAGGTEGGAERSVIRLLETVGLACYLMAQDQRPEVLFAGNQNLVGEVETLLQPYASLHITSNVRPDLEHENITQANREMAEIFKEVRLRQINGLHEINAWSGQRIQPTASAFGQIIAFLSKIYDGNKGVLGIDVGASATTIAAASAGELSLGVYSQLGLGERLPELLNHTSLVDITQWFPLDISEDYVRDYISTKQIYPRSLPATAEDMAIELAITRQVIRTALSKASPGFPKGLGRSGKDLIPWFEPILSTGSALAKSPSFGQTMLTLLDAIQPTGITTMVLDQNGLTAPLGAAASINPFLVVQVIESNTFINLGSVISPVANVRPGTPIIRMKVTPDEGEETVLDIKQGELEVIQLAQGMTAQLHLQPLHKAEVGMGGPGRSGKLRVVGGVLGVVVDARGRPLQMVQDAGKRRELMGKWLWSLGG
jgi:hypothetical protein